jgi:phage tail-like protein
MGDEKVIPIAYATISADADFGGVFTACTFPSLTLKTESLSVFTAQGVNETINTNAMLTYGDVTLTRGITDSTAFSDWATTLNENGLDGNTKDLTLSACDNKGTAVMTWSLSAAYIKSYTPSQAQAGGPAVLTESVVLGYKEAKRTA